MNRSYLAVHVVTVRRAFVLLYQSRAEVIDSDDGQFANFDFPSWCEMSRLRRDNGFLHRRDWIRTVQLPIEVPRVIRLMDYDRRQVTTPRFNRRNVFARDGHRCQYCGRRFPAQELTMDHVMPRSRGGPTTWENVVSSCMPCNTRKGGCTPDEARMRLLCLPTRPARHPQLELNLNDPRYQSWRPFLPESRRNAARGV